MSALMSSELTYGKPKRFLFDNMFALDLQYICVMLKSYFFRMLAQLRWSRFC